MGITNPFLPFENPMANNSPINYKKYLLPNSVRDRKRIDGSRPKSKGSREGTRNRRITFAEPLSFCHILLADSGIYIHVENEVVDILTTP
jgi:hypothetical protein